MLPFLAVLSNPDGLLLQPVVQAFAARAGFTAANQLLMPAMLVFVTATVLAALIRLANLWLSERLAAAVGSDLSCEAYRRTLYQPYEVHLMRNSAELITGTTIQLNRTVNAITALLKLITSGLVATGLLLGMLLIDLEVALGAIGLFGGVYVLLAVTVRHQLNRNSHRITATAKQLIKALQEGLGAIRDVLLDGNQQNFYVIYRQADRPHRLHQAQNRFLAAFPRYALEALGMVAIALLGGFLVMQQGSGAAVIPLLGALALGAQRLLPALQQMYANWSNVKGYHADLFGVLSMLDQPLPSLVHATEPLPMLEGIRLDCVHFRYGPDQAEVLRGLSSIFAAANALVLLALLAAVRAPRSTSSWVC